MLDFSPELDLATSTNTVAESDSGILSNSNPDGKSPELYPPIRIEGEDFNLGGQDGLDASELFSQSSTLDDTEDDDGFDTAIIKPGNFLTYTTDVEEGTYDLRVRVHSAAADVNSLQVKLDDELLGTFEVTGTPNDWYSWQTMTIKDIDLSGNEEGQLKLETDADTRISLDWIELKPAPDASDIFQETPADGSADGIKEIVANNDLFEYSGRVEDPDSQAPSFSFPGTAVKFKFTGTSLQLKLSEDNWGSENYLDVYLDGSSKPTTINLQPGEEPSLYNVASDLEDTTHEVEIVKRNDYTAGEFKFHGVAIDASEKVLPFPASGRKIEVYGDSISTGKWVEYGAAGSQDPGGDNNILTNVNQSYASMLATEYDAELSLVAQAGVSLVDGYGYWNNGTGMESIYDQIKPIDDSPKWNSDNYKPDLIVIALGQNDSSSINIGTDMSATEWKDRYKQFIGNLRAKNPNAYFVGMFPNMIHDRQWDTYLTEAIAEYQAENDDEKVYSLINQQLTPGHPRVTEQKAMAKNLQNLINTTLVEDGFTWNVAK